MAETLPPAVQRFAVEAAEYIAGIDEMIAANMRLAESIRVTAEQARAMEGQAAGGAEAGAVGAAGGADAAAAAAGQKDLADAERMVAGAARVEQETLQMLAETERMAAEASKAVADGMRAEAAAMKTTRDAAAALKVEEEGAAAASTKAAEGSKLLGVQAALSGKKVSELKNENGNLMQSLNKIGGATILAAGAFAGYGMKAAADFQTQILRLKTSAGETGDLLNGKFTGDLKVVSDGILKLSVDTATSTKDLTGGMYMIESAGFRGADGLNVLKAAAEGARAEGADLSTVGNALTTMMKDYHIQAKDAVPAMNQLIAVVSQGKTTMQDLAGALHSVLPIAASVHLSFAEVGGAIATMTSHGVSADLATQHLANLIRNLVAPNKVAAGEMTKLGLSATDLGQHLGQRGLTGTMDLLMKAVLANVDKKTGLVLAQQLDQSKVAAAQAKTEFQQMPPAVQKLAQGFLNGSGNVKGFDTAVKKLPLGQQELLKAFEANSKKADGFNTALKGNKQAAETVDASLKKLTGGAVGLESALQLTGQNAGDFKKSVQAVADAAQHGGKHVENWQQIQKTFNFQLEQAKQSLNRVAITIGTELIPKVQAVMKWLSQHPTLVKDIALAIGIFLAAAAAIKIMSIAMGILNLVMDANPIGLIIIAIAALVVGFLYLWTHVKGFRDFWISAWHDLQAAAKNTWNFLETVWHGIAAGALWLWHNVIDPTWHGIEAAWHGIAAAAQWAWSNVIKPTFDYISAGYRLVGAVIMWWWHNVVEAAYKAVVGYIHWWWDNAKPVFDHFVAGLHLIADVLLWWWHNVMEPAYKAVGELILLWYNNVVKPAFGLVVAAVHLLADAFMWWWHSIVEPAFNGVKTVISAVANAVVGYFHWWVDSAKTVLGWFANIATLLWNYFIAGYNAVVNAVGKIFSFIAGIPGTVIHLLSSLYDDMLQIGKNIIIGIWNGLVSMASWLASSIEHLISNIIPGPIKSVLGISSPSKLMHGFGQNIAQGLAFGMTSQAGQVYAAASALAKTAAAGAGQMGSLTVGVSGSYGGLSGALAVSGQGAGAALGGSFAAQIVSGSPSSGGTGAVQVVNVHLEVHGAVTAQRDLVQAVQKAVLQTNVRNPTNALSLPSGR